MTQESKGNLCFLVEGACLPGALVIRSDDRILVKARLPRYIFLQQQAPIMSLWDKVQAGVKKTGEKAGVAAHKAKLRTDMYVPVVVTCYPSSSSPNPLAYP